jgi:hypothetical protein
VTYGTIYVLRAQDLVIMFPSFYIRTFVYFDFKGLFTNYEDFQLLGNIKVHRFSLHIRQ